MALSLLLALLVAAPPVPSPGPGPAPGSGEREVRLRLVAWRRAWEAQDVEGFLACYSPRFRQGRLDRDRLLEQKRRVFAPGRPVEVTMEAIAITVAGDQATAEFDQIYVSERHRDRGRKTLTLRREEGEWRIIGESFTPSS